MQGKFFSSDHNAKNLILDFFFYEGTERCRSELLTNPADTRHSFNVDTASYDVVRRRIDVETTSCAYRKIHRSQRFYLKMYLKLQINSLLRVVSFLIN